MEETRSGAREMAMRILYQVSVFEKAKASYDLDEMFMDIEGRNKEFIENIVNEVILKKEELDNSFYSTDMFKKKDFEDDSNDFVDEEKLGIGIKILIALVIIVFVVGLVLFIKSVI